MHIKPNGNAFDVLDDRDQLLVGGLATYAAAQAWIDENQNDWPPAWDTLKAN